MKLTRREMEVLQLIGKELTTEQIATYLHVSVPTIETHRRNLFRKVGVQSVIGLVKEAIRNNWIKIDNQTSIQP
ncbi:MULTISPECIES: response regulator transcription factor [Emticicia]|uniref:response regulator transcription factor n=1 Tax=Emticicia TaxID=312278 RepID=UPI0007D8A559|nr:MULTISPECIES: LuxR C-terminal-related transcriptional regulator [Emticicia]